MREIFRVWRRRDVVGASLAWAGWLVRRGRGAEAGEVVRSARAEVAGSERLLEVEEGWRKVLAEVDAGSKEEGDADEDQDEEMLDA